MTIQNKQVAEGMVREENTEILSYKKLHSLLNQIWNKKNRQPQI